MVESEPLAEDDPPPLPSSDDPDWVPLEPESPDPTDPPLIPLRLPDRSVPWYAEEPLLQPSSRATDARQPVQMMDVEVMTSAPRDGRALLCQRTSPDLRARRRIPQCIRFSHSDEGIGDGACTPPTA
jgi:hypothetical protein